MALTTSSSDDYGALLRRLNAAATGGAMPPAAQCPSIVLYSVRVVAVLGSKMSCVVSQTVRSICFGRIIVHVRR